VIRLRELAPGDAPAIREVYGGESVRFLGRGPMNEREAREFVADASRHARADPRARYILGIVARDDLVGVAKLAVIDGHGRISYILRRDAWGHGHATAAVRALLGLAFDVLGLPLVHAKHHVDNPASGHVLAATGFTPFDAETGFRHYRARNPRPRGDLCGTGRTGVT